MEDAVYGRIRRFVSESGIERLLDTCEAVIVAFSGGADSSFLLNYMVSEYKNIKICAAHFNHMIRGAQADSDLSFCRDRCLKYSIDFFEESADVPNEAKSMGVGTEECARILRYNFLDKCRESLAEKMRVSENRILIATAHNADDNLETVLFNLTRGSALRGLCGIPPVREKKYIRPVLCLSSEEIRRYCAENGIDYTVDYTNAENIYTRNKIRHTVVPVLRAVNPSVHFAALRCSRAAAGDNEFLERLAAESLGEYSNKTFAPLGLLRSMEFPLLSRALIILFKNVCGKDISSVHIGKITELLYKDGIFRFSLPGGVSACIGEEVSFVLNGAADKEKCDDFEFVLEKDSPEHTELGFFLSLCDIKEMKEEINSNVYNTLINTVIINDKIKGTLVVRNRREHDVYKYGGMSRKVKKLFCDKKIPAEMRRRIPLVCDDEGIVWIPGFPPRDSVRSKGESDAKYVLTYYSYNPEGKQ